MTQALEPRGRKAAPVANATNPIELLQFAVNSKASPAELREIMAMVNEWRAREAEEAYGLAMAGFQAECPRIEKTREVTNRDGDVMYRFANKEDIDRTIRPLLEKFNLSISSAVAIEGEQPKGVVRITWTIQCGAHKEKREYTLPMMAIAGIVGGGTNAIQNLGAWMSYMTRYTLCEALHITVADEDTDGQAVRDLLLIDEEQRKFIDDCLTTGIVRPDGKAITLKLDGLLEFVQANVPAEERSLDRMTQPQFERFVGAFKLKYLPKAKTAKKGGAA